MASPSDFLLQDVVCVEQSTGGKTEHEDSGGKGCHCRILQNAYMEEEDAYNFICHVNNSFNKSVFGLLMLTIGLAVSALCLTFGIMEFHNCPCEPLLPLFLSLNGTALLFKCVLQGARIMCNIAPPEGERHCLYTVTDMLTLFLVFWGCTGAVLVYNLLKIVQTENKSATHYCDFHLLTLAIAVVTVTFVVIIFTLVCYAILWFIHDKMESSQSFKNFIVESEMERQKSPLCVLGR
ncbi:uncharacterized protein LOC125671619 [Ostrea edulis]|uniref:uncharacterized protein LOC125671619 n=1 Tax=Ostrea edulis TaxID=37623 RepID=UPI002094ABE7|nr:uncharacterized protein LOC125671619 [Ostrea edulis]